MRADVLIDTADVAHGIFITDNGPVCDRCGFSRLYRYLVSDDGQRVQAKCCCCDHVSSFDTVAPLRHDVRAVRAEHERRMRQ